MATTTACTASPALFEQSFVPPRTVEPPDPRIELHAVAYLRDGVALRLRAPGPGGISRERLEACVLWLDELAYPPVSITRDAGVWELRYALGRPLRQRAQLRCFASREASAPSLLWIPAMPTAPEP